MSSVDGALGVAIGAPKACISGVDALAAISQRSFRWASLLHSAPQVGADLIAVNRRLPSAPSDITSERTLEGTLRSHCGACIPALCDSSMRDSRSTLRRPPRWSVLQGAVSGPLFKRSSRLSGISVDVDSLHFEAGGYIAAVTASLK